LQRRVRHAVSVIVSIAASAISTGGMIRAAIRVWQAALTGAVAGVPAKALVSMQLFVRPQIMSFSVAGLTLWPTARGS
jgi:hypothetical protein